MGTAITIAIILILLVSGFGLVFSIGRIIGKW